MDGLSIAWIITTLVLPAITGVTGWFTGRRRSDAEARKVEAEAKMVEAETRKMEITNENSVIEQYKSALADNQAHMAEMRLMNADLIANLEPMRKRISHLETAVTKLKQENNRLKKEVQS